MYEVTFLPENSFTPKVAYMALSAIASYCEGKLVVSIKPVGDAVIPGIDD